MWVGILLALESEPEEEGGRGRSKMKDTMSTAKSDLHTRQFLFACMHAQAGVTPNQTEA